MFWVKILIQTTRRKEINVQLLVPVHQSGYQAGQDLSEPGSLQYTSSLCLYVVIYVIFFHGSSKKVIYHNIIHRESTEFT